MRKFALCISLIVAERSFSQDYYDLARLNFNENRIDSARLYINKSLARRLGADDYFLSAMIHEAENKQLRAVADYEAVIQRQPNNLEAYFQKGLIYYNTASIQQAIKDFSYVIDNQSTSETKAIYFANDPTGARGTYLTTLQSMIGRVYQYRGLAYQKNGQSELALADLKKSLEYDSTADAFINRSHIYETSGNLKKAIADLQSATSIESDNYLAWYNLALLEPSTRLPQDLIEDESFIPMLQLLGANAYEEGDYDAAVNYYTKAIEANIEEEKGYIGRGKAFIQTGSYALARQDFINAMELNPSLWEAFYLIGNTFFHEKKFDEAVSFYERYLSIDTEYGIVWFNAAMSYLSLRQTKRACDCLKRAGELNMKQSEVLQQKYCRD